jgi:hypothetical protein
VQAGFKALREGLNGLRLITRRLKRQVEFKILAHCLPIIP